MKRLLPVSLVVLVMMIFAGAAYAAGRDFHHHKFRDHGFRGHGFRSEIIVGPLWAPAPWWGPYPYSYHYPYGYREPAVVIEREPETYIQQNDEPREPYYWYYCKNPKGYYPYVKSCPDGWKKVLPTPPPDEKE